MKLVLPCRATMLLFFWGFGCLSLSQAQEPMRQAITTLSVSETQGTAPDELLKILLDRNKELSAARAQLRQAEARLVQARVRPNPTLEVEHGNDVLFASEGERDFSLSFSQPIELGGKRGKRMRVAELQIEMARAQLADTERQLAAQLRVLFGETLAAEARLRLLAQVNELNRQMTQVMEVRLQAGDASRLDASLLLTETNRIEAQRVQAEAELAGLVLQIKTLAGLAPDEPLALRGRFDPHNLDLTPAAALQLALQNRPDLRAARLREETAEAAIASAKAQAAPNLNVFVRYSQNTDAIEGLPTTTQRIVDQGRQLSAGVSIPLPFWNRYRGEAAEAIAQQAQARAQREGLELMVRRDVLLAFQRYEAARRVLEVLSRGVLGQTQESLQIVKLAYDLGEMRLIDVINQQRAFAEAQMSYAAAQKDFYAAVTELGRAVGEPVTRSQP